MLGVLRPLAAFLVELLAPPRTMSAVVQEQTQTP
jgi:hypothetical protein